jgi:hypothetical protein
LLFQKPGFMAEWWPSSARLAVNRDYLHDHHAPHWTDVMVVLQQHLDRLETRGQGCPRSFLNPR